MGFFRFAWRLPVLFVGAVVTALLAGTPRPAEAQTLSITTTGIKRQQPLRTDPTSRFEVSRADCLANDVIEFPVIVGSYAQSALEVWATQTSDPCTSDTARTTVSATCWRLYSQIPNSTTLTVKIRVQDFAARPAGTDGIDLGTAASCASLSSTAQPVTLWFMFLQGNTQVGASGSWPTTVDLVGPAPPGVQSLGAGSGLLKLGWEVNTDPDVVGYKVFCENLGSTSTGVTIYDSAPPVPEASNSATCPDAGSGTGTTDDDAGDASDDDAGDGSEEAGGAATDATCTPPASDGSTGTRSCGSVLVEGKILTPEQIAQYSCASTTGQRATSANITHLTNFERYAVAVVASDLVENVGALSAVQCNMPQPVNGFDETYRSAGGTAGGASFCSLGLRSAAARAKLWPAAAFVAVVALGRWRRRPHRLRRMRVA